MFKFAIYVSNHGFGHATRMAALAEEFNRFGIFTHVRSARPDFLFRELNPALSCKEDAICDVGVRHTKNLLPDLAETRSAILEIMNRRLEIIEREVEFLRRERIDLIIADIPWLPVEAGTYSGIPVFAISNFDWLFIYERLFVGERRTRPVLNTIFGLYQRVDRAFRLPLSSSSSMASFRNIEKVGLLALRKPVYGDLPSEYGLEPGKPILTCSFGGEGKLDIDLKQVCRAWPGYVFSSQMISVPNHIQVGNDADFADLVHGSDVLLTKPGYSSFAEALQDGKFLIYRPRENYPEEEVLIRGIARYPHQAKLDEFPRSVRAWKTLFKGIDLRETGKEKVANANARIAALMLQRFVELRYSKRKLTSVFDVGSNNLNYALCASDAPIPLHTAQISTGLGKNYQVSEDGSVRVPLADLKSFQKKMGDFLQYDAGIPSLKRAIGTGIHRKLDSGRQLSEWFNCRKISFQVLSEKDETELAWLAARSLIAPNHTALSVDVGGFSTELSWGDDRKKHAGTSLHLGLLTLRQAAREGLSVAQTISEELQKHELPQPDLVICIGLAATFLARIVKRERFFTPEALHGARISRQELLGFREKLASGEVAELLQSAMEPQAPDILELSALYYTLLLDKFSATEFLVCYYGISAGYNLWNKRQRA